VNNKYAIGTVIGSALLALAKSSSLGSKGTLGTVKVPSNGMVDISEKSSLVCPGGLSACLDFYEALSRLSPEELRDHNLINAISQKHDYLGYGQDVRNTIMGSYSVSNEILRERQFPIAIDDVVFKEGLGNEKILADLVLSIAPKTVEEDHSGAWMGNIKPHSIEPVRFVSAEVTEEMSWDDEETGEYGYQQVEKLHQFDLLQYSFDESEWSREYNLKDLDEWEDYDDESYDHEIVLDNMLDVLPNTNPLYDRIIKTSFAILIANFLHTWDNYDYNETSRSWCFDHFIDKGYSIGVEMDGLEVSAYGIAYSEEDEDIPIKELDWFSQVSPKYIFNKVMKSEITFSEKSSDNFIECKIVLRDLFHSLTFYFKGYVKNLTGAACDHELGISNMLNANFVYKIHFMKLLMVIATLRQGDSDRKKLIESSPKWFQERIKNGPDQFFTGVDIETIRRR